MSCDTSLRMNALSSTTRTVRALEDDIALPHRLHDNAAIAGVEEHGKSVLASDVLRGDRDPGQLQGLPHREHVALAHRQAGDRHERAEHAGPADELGAHSLRPGASGG